jgi:protein-disulfide isomerase
MAKRSQLPKQRSRPQAGTARARSQPSGLLLFGIVAAVVLVVIVVIVLQAQSVRQPVQITARPGEGTAWGPSQAKVTILGFSDFGCTHCRSFALGQGRQLRAEYEATGEVRFEYKHFIVGGSDTANAANAAECAADQGRFWDYHDLLFSQQGVVADPFSKSALKRYAAQLGLDTARFNRCVDGDQHLEKVYRDTAEGRDLGVTGTPTFFINGQKVVGAVPYTEFRAKVQEALEK